MNDYGADLVAGERRDELIAALLEARLSPVADGVVRLNMDLPDNCPLIRALMRVEAELILMDADAMAHGRFEHRTSDQRRADAFMALALRAADVPGI
jgi:hypothetical protein